MDNLTYPNMKADLELCRQQLNELCGEERKTAFRRIPPQRIDFDLQFAAAFKELQAYRDTGLMPDEIPHWIPVSERLPVKSEYREKDTGELIPLLVCVKGTKYPFRAMYDGKTWGDGISKIEVTHWQPLPQPPKGEKS